MIGLPETLLAQLSKLLGYHGAVSEEIFRQVGLDPELPAHRHLIRLSGELLDFPRHLSIHPGGFLLGHEPVRIRRGDRIAQLVVQRLPDVVLREAPRLPPTVRGAQGFGHTGDR